MTLIVDYQYFGDIIYNKILFEYSNINFSLYERYQKSTHRNKMELPGPNGVLSLSIPIIGGRDQKLPFKDIKIDYTQMWQAKHYKAIYATYKNSPWFEHYEPSLTALYKQQPSLLYQWNNLCVTWVLKNLKHNAILTDIEDIANLPPIAQVDDRTAFSSKKNKDLPHFEVPKYYQVFEDRTGFVPNMCILDLLFCEGPNASNMLKNMKLPVL